MSQRSKKPKLDRSDDSDYSEQEISIHASYDEEEFTISSPRSREERRDTESPPASQDSEMMLDSEPFQLTKLSSESGRKRKERQYRSGLGEEPQGHYSSEKGHRPRHRYDDDALRKRQTYSHSRSPIPSRGASSRDRGDRLLRGGSLRREASSSRHSPLFVDERSRESLREELRYGGREVDHEDSGRYHERLSGGSSRLLTVREDSRHSSSRRGSREVREVHEREHSGHHRDLKPIRSSSLRVGGERGGGLSLLRDDRRPSLKESRSPRRIIEHSDRPRPPSRREVSSSHHYSRSVEREHQKERHQKVREERRERRERHHKSHHHRSRREAAEAEKESAEVADIMITLSSESGGEEVAGTVDEERDDSRGRGENIEDLIQDLESGSSSGEISEEEGESEGEGGGVSPGTKDDDTSSSKAKSSDGEVHSPSPEGGAKPQKLKSKFDSDTESDSDDKPPPKKSPPSSSRNQARGYSDYHDTVMSEEEHSEDEVIPEQPEGSESDDDEMQEEKESDLSAQLSRELGEVEKSPTPEKELPCYLPALMGCRNVEENYDYLNKIEEGTYGVVHRAKDKKTGEVFALKRLKLENEKEGFPITSLREIDMLLKAKHPNIVGVREIVLGKNMDRIYIVFEYVEHDLKELMETMKQPFLQGEVKTLMIQLLRAVHHLHDNWIIHRDLKASNLLVSHRAILKVADFGLAREYGSPLRKYTPVVVTLWYRSPELLLGAPEYSTPVDIWSVGCIFAEMMLQKPLFQGKGEIDQLNQIFKLLGTPNEQIWSGYNELPTVKKVTFTNQPYNHLRKKFPPSLLTQNGFDLLNRFLTYDPKKRITAREALDHKYFKEAPLPIPPSMFNTWPAKSEMGHRKKAKSPTPPEGGAFQFAEDGPGFNLKF